MTNFFHEYQPFEVIEKTLKSLAERERTRCELTTLSEKSVHGRNIYVFTINPNATSPTNVIVAGEHGKDWIAITSVIYYIGYVLRQS